MTVLQKPPARSVQVDIAVEDLEGALKELPPLLIRYWREIGEADLEDAEVGEHGGVFPSDRRSWEGHGESR